MKTKNNSQKIVSAKIVAKLVELANRYVVPFVKINVPGKYTAKEMADEVDSLGNKLFYKFDYDNSEVQELVVRIADDDFSQSELAELGFSPKIKLTLICEKVFFAIAKYERLAGIKLANVAKFVVGEPETLYETERAKVVLFDYAKKRILTKTKTITIISDCLAIYLNKKNNYAFCLKINGKWINVLNRVGYFNLAETIERAKRIITYKSTKSGAETYIAKKADAYADFARMILEEFRAMDKATKPKQPTMPSRLPKQREVPKHNPQPRAINVAVVMPMCGNKPMHRKARRAHRQSKANAKKRDGVNQPF